MCGIVRKCDIDKNLHRERVGSPRKSEYKQLTKSKRVSIEWQLLWK